MGLVAEVPLDLARVGGSLPDFGPEKSKRTQQSATRYRHRHRSTRPLQNTSNMRDACEQSGDFFATILQGWVYKTQQTCEMHASNLTFSL